jgi:hypothetical protein
MTEEDPKIDKGRAIAGAIAPILKDFAEKMPVGELVREAIAGVFDELLNDIVGMSEELSRLKTANVIYAERIGEGVKREVKIRQKINGLAATVEQGAFGVGENERLAGILRYYASEVGEGGES